jgi:hypothetical protein
MLSHQSDCHSERSEESLLANDGGGNTHFGRVGQWRRMKKLLNPLYQVAIGKPANFADFYISIECKELSPIV